ncbi:MAG: ABC transporter ATP-binding protein [Oscillospiraceae bacterium]|nr:ABC transporter ATP-binding protein [Oscillospiraceae bacterium]
MMVLEIKDLHVSYGSIEALHGISLELDENEVVALVGSNGAGKTTTLKAISGQIKVSSGDICFNGRSIIREKPHKIAAMGIVQVPEGRKIFYKLSVRENLMMGAYSLKDKEEIEKNLNMVLSAFPILKERFNQSGGTLSGGEQQMLAVGRALMASPKVLLLDEPSLGLAPLVVETIAEKITEISNLGIPILLVEQNANLALELSSRAYVIETGNIEISGVSDELLGNEDIQKAYLGIGD